jgi:AraC-like DNA-binding protein
MSPSPLLITQFLFVAFAFVLAGLTLASSRSRWLGVFFLIIGLHGAFSRLPFAAGTILNEYSYALAFAYGPLLYFALSGLLRDQRLLLWQPFVAAGAMIAGAVMIAVEQPDAVLGALLTIIQLAAVIVAFREIRMYQGIVEQARSTEAVSAIRWVRSALALYAFFVVSLALRSAFSTVLGDVAMAIVNQSVAIAITFTLAAITIKALRDSGWIPQATQAEQALTAEFGADVASPSKEQIERAGQIDEFLADERSYLDPELTVAKLAGQLGWSPRECSELINRVQKVSFSKKINGLRVEEAKRLIAGSSNKSLSLLEIAMASGFNSKSAFNLMFKRYTGQTPSEYRKSLPD